MNIFQMLDLVQKGETVFHQGQELADAAVWKDRTNVVNKLVVLMGGLIGVARVVGYDIHVDDQTLGEIAVCIAGGVALFNNVMHVITSRKIGISTVQD